MSNMETDQVQQENDVETDGTENVKSPIQFQVSMVSDRSEEETSAEPTVETPMLTSSPSEGRNGKVQYSIGDMEVVEVVSILYIIIVYFC